jgi:hypothetical protein
MGLNIINSPDITFLEYVCTWDIAGTLPLITLTNNCIMITGQGRIAILNLVAHRIH